MNEYEPENKLQKAYESLFGSCLCGHFESCMYCDGSMTNARIAIRDAAEVLDYQLYRHDVSFVDGKIKESYVPIKRKIDENENGENDRSPRLGCYRNRDLR